MDEEAEKEEVDAELEPEPEPDKIDLLIRPVDDGWSMGPDLKVTMLLDDTQGDIKHKIEKLKPQISVHRMVLTDPYDQVLNAQRNTNTFRRLGLSENSVYTLNPTINGSWLWNSQEWYEEKLVKDIYALIDKDPRRRAPLSEIKKKIVVPPFIKVSLQVFCRRLPDAIYMHVDTSNGEYWLSRPPHVKDVLYQLPTFSNVPGDTAFITHHTPDPFFDWEEHADINDTKRVELDFDIPNIDYNVTILRAENIKRADVFGSSDPQCFVKFFDGYEEKDLGKTVCKRNTLNPEWRDEVFTLSINASIEVENTWLLIDMFDCDIGPSGQDLPGDYLGCVELAGDDIEFLIADGKTHEVAYNLQPRQQSAPHDDQEGITGLLHLKGGKAGFEVNFMAGRTLVPLPNLTSHVFGVVLWKVGDQEGDEILETLPNNNQRDPIFNETCHIPFSEMSTKLEDCTLEFQVWSTVGKEADKSVDPDARGRFMGSLGLTGEDLVDFLRGNEPYARVLRRGAKPSKNVPLKMRKVPVEGYVLAVGGPSGLPMQPGKKMEINLQFCDRLAKIFDCIISVEWNFVKVYESSPTRIELGKANFNEKIRVETEGGSDDCRSSHLRLDLWEDISQAFGNVEQQYLGCIEVSGEDLSQLMDGKYARVINFDWQTDDTKPAKMQRMVRGFISLRGGALGNRSESERCIVIKAAKNLARANTGAMLGVGSSDPFVEVTINGNFVYRTPAIEASLDPVWNDLVVYVPIPDLREFSEKELKKWIRDNDERMENGEKPRERTVFHESTLQIAVYDETDSGGKGACLGVVRWGEDEMVRFFDCAEPHETWYPLGKDDRKENTDSATKYPTLGKDSQIYLGSTGKKYVSPLKWKADVEAALQAEQDRLRAEEEERIALELARLEKERQAAELAEQREREREEEAERKRKEAEEAAAAALEAKNAEVSAEEAKAKAEAEAKAKEEAEAKREADREAYQEMMELADEDDD